MHFIYIIATIQVGMLSTKATKAIDQSETVIVTSQGVKPIIPSFHLNSGPAISVKAAVLNAHSVMNKGDTGIRTHAWPPSSLLKFGQYLEKEEVTIKHYIEDNKLEIVALTETWLSNDNGDQIYVKEMTPSGYKCGHKSRK